jgi:tRNA threonylcarbamoyladenosine biosynthesis protein TsaB
VISLVLDASTYRGTVAVLEDARLLVGTAVAMRGRDEERLMPAVGQVLRDAGFGLSAVQRVVCGAGPGSFTSLRIAASLAKGIAVGRNVPLYAVSSLALIVAANVTDGPREPRRYLAVQDALRGESFVAGFEHHEGVVRQVSELRTVPTSSVPTVGEAEHARPVGPDQPGEWHPNARGAALLMSSILDAGPVELAGWEPVYGRLPEAQVRWEASHGRPLQT